MEEYLKAFMDNFIPITTLCVVIATFISARATHKSTDVVKEGLLAQLRPEPILSGKLIPPSDPNQKHQYQIKIESESGKPSGEVVDLKVIFECVNPKTFPSVVIDFKHVDGCDFSSSNPIERVQLIEGDWLKRCMDRMITHELIFKDSRGLRTYKLIRVQGLGDTVIQGTVIKPGKIKIWIHSFRAFRFLRSTK